MKTPLISVIIPTFNRLTLLQRAIASVEKQSYPHWELIIVDDGSTDGTSKWLETTPYTFLSIKNSGVSAARNQGLSKASGEWVAFLDSDDEWLPHKLEKQVAKANVHPECPLIHGEEIWIRKGVRVNQMKKHQKFGGEIFEKCLPLCLISPSASMIKSDLLRSLGGFREDFPVCEDYELWLRITSVFPVGFVSDPIIVKYGGHEDQLSKSSVMMDYWRVLALHDLLMKGELSDHQKQLVSMEIEKKATVFLKGHEKHQNYPHEAHFLKNLLGKR